MSEQFYCHTQDARPENQNTQGKREESWGAAYCPAQDKTVFGHVKDPPGASSMRKQAEGEREARKAPTHEYPTPGKPEEPRMAPERRTRGRNAQPAQRSQRISVANSVSSEREQAQEDSFERGQEDLQNARRSVRNGHELAEIWKTEGGRDM